MVVGPRYIPGQTRVAGLAGAGWAVNTDEVADAARITPPVRLPSEGVANPVSLDIELDAGVPLARVESAFLGISHRPAGAHRVRIDVEGDALPADKDLELVWTPESGAQPAAALFAESVGDDGYVLGMVLPPAPDRSAPPPPREAIFVIDTSGSMAGSSLPQARAALRLGLDGLRPEDRFNVIQFNSYTSALFNSPRPADAVNLERARRYVAGLQAEGGTQMMSAIEAALDGAAGGGRLRQVVFLTDGSVGNETALFRRITERLGDSRLFTVGIGSAPNGYFMTRAAKFGRGTYTYIGEVNQVAERMGALLLKLERPALTDLAVRWPEGARAETWPARLPDLYAGEPVVFAAKLDGGVLEHGGQVLVSGKLDGRPWQARLDLSRAAAGGATSHPGVAAVWARRKIAALMESKLDGAAADAIRAAVIEVALAHRLVSRYTSLVAVDVTPARPVDATLTSHAVPVNLPRGWEYAKVFGALPQTATPAGLHLALGGTLLLLAASLWWWRRREGAA
jgi:Ca-activated chloride channel family protein